MTFLQKYWKIYKIYVSKTIVYRVRALIWVLNDSLMVFIMPLIWLAAFGTRESIAGFSKQELVTYYLILGLVMIFVTPHPEEKMNEQIKDGKVSIWLIRPFSYFKDFFFGDFAFGINRLLFFSPLCIIVFFLYRNYFVFPNFFMPILMILAGIIIFFTFFCLSFSIGAMSFWFDNASSLHTIYWFTIMLFSGELAPLEFLPKFLQNIAIVLPFKYFYYFPVKMYLGHLTPMEIVQGFLILIFWSSASFFIYKTVWHFGTKRYSAVGG